jgi:phage terminase large subunit
MDHEGWGRQKRIEHPDEYVLVNGHPEFGCDVARFGDDRTVIYGGGGSFVEPAVVIHQQDTQIVGKRIVDLIDFSNWQTKVRIDDTGVGGGVTDFRTHFRADNYKHFTIVPVNFGSSSIESKKMKANPSTTAMNKQPTIDEKKPKFANRRAEMYWNIRDLINAKKIWLPDDEELCNELASIRYTYDPKEQIIIEPKKDMKKRTSKSPDKADALILRMAGSRVSMLQRMKIPTKRAPTGQPLVPTSTAGLVKKHSPRITRHAGGSIMGGMKRRY